MPTEAQARITINRLLEEAGWRFVPDGKGNPANIICEHRVNKKTLANLELGMDFEHAPSGFVDYVLQNGDGRPVAVVEAKRESIDPLTAKEQARAYAEGLGVDHIFLSNGLVHYYWNLAQGNPTRVSRFLPIEQLGKASEWSPDAKRLSDVNVDENYIAVSQDAAWRSYTAEERPGVAINKKIRLLRDYQLDAIRHLQRAAGKNQNRFLMEMATGTGKTLLSAAISKLYLRSENAHRILFLVDRLELERQAYTNFNDYLANDGIRTVIYKEKRQDWMNAQVVVTTIQSLATRNRFLTDFAPTDFQFIISDEAHRTISGNNRAIFEYFVGAKLGLTATPRDYLKGVSGPDQKSDPREYERRLLLDTYHTFGCDDGEPTFRYSLVDAVKHNPPYLVNPVSLDARTDITTEMLSDGGYTVTAPTDEDGEESELQFVKKDYERKFFSEETNRSFVECFFDNAKCDPISGEIGKTICFAVSRVHAGKLVALMNEEAALRFPDVYGKGSAFAVQVTSGITGAQQMTIEFKNNNLNGRSRWRSDEFRDYETSRTRVCITVGMMTTGYDCEDVLNVVLARPIFSPTDFIQIKGRGTRLYQFSHNGGKITAKKDSFTLFDFFANCEYFEKEFDYDKKLLLAKKSKKKPRPDPPPYVADDFTNTSPDPLKLLVRDAVGIEGMKIDREMFRQRFAEQARDARDIDESLREAIENGNWPEAEQRAKELLLNKPKEFWNLGKLQELYRSDRNPSLREILRHVFGLSPEIPTRAQLANEAFERYVSTEQINATHLRELRDVFQAFLLDSYARQVVESGKFADLRATDASLYQSISTLSTQEREAALRYIANEVKLGEFETSM